jgi:hypothetical protein
LKMRSEVMEDRAVMSVAVMSVALNYHWRDQVDSTQTNNREGGERAFLYVKELGLR